VNPTQSHFGFRDCQPGHDVANCEILAWRPR
jgi:hypothetical protein